MPSYQGPDGTKYDTAEDLTPEELKEPLSIIVSLKSVIAWSKKVREMRKITEHMQKNIVHIQRLVDENTTWNEYLNDYAEEFKKLVPQAVLSYCEAPSIPETSTSEAENTTSDAKT